MAWWDLLKFSVEACLLIFHATVLSCVLYEKLYKNAQFSSPFYAFYILQSTFDVLFVLAVRFLFMDPSPSEHRVPVKTVNGKRGAYNS